MIQITGLTKVYRRGRPPALLDLTFDARPGVVTALLGAEGAGKTTALRLMVELERGQGITLFSGRTYRRLRHPEREVGVLLPEGGHGSGHPGMRARAHLRMLAAAAGVPASRADELLEQTRLAGVADHRLRSFSPGMHRRLALAAALLGSPGTLLLDGPTEGLSPRNIEWFHSFLRSFGVSGGTVLVTTSTPQEAAALADRVVTLDQGRLVADQPVSEFRRTRLHPEVSVRGPQMARLADLLTEQGHDVRRDGGTGLAVSGLTRTEIGELAYRNGILLHELADRVVEQPVPYPVLPTASGRSGHVQPVPVPTGGSPGEAAATPARLLSQTPATSSAQATAPTPTPAPAPAVLATVAGVAAGPPSQQHPAHTESAQEQTAVLLAHPIAPGVHPVPAPTQAEPPAAPAPVLAAAAVTSDTRPPGPPGAGAGPEPGSAPRAITLSGRQLFRDELPATAPAFDALRPHPAPAPTPPTALPTPSTPAAPYPAAPEPWSE
ncbi:ATP-binding cassette domain-containing protein [Kitasatospora sp. NPDC051853]|uniref:ATP-binding cassette domain-containing protein n=1 Tax=Kitasatospora sp. NPDC051853 TaxID=3364058 RepID=UPI0037A49F17